MLVDGQQLAGSLYRQRLEEHGIEQREDRRVRANAERQRDCGRGSEAGRAAQRPHCVFHVLLKCVEHRHS